MHKSWQNCSRKFADTLNSALHCSYEQETKMTTPQIWQYWITSTMAKWHRWTWSLQVLNEDIAYWFGKLRRFWFYIQISLNCNNMLSWSSARTSSCHQRCCERVCNDAVMRMVKWALEPGGVHNTVPKNSQIRTPQWQNSALHCSYEQETDNSSNLEVLDSLNCVITERQTAMLKILVYASF